MKWEELIHQFDTKKKPTYLKQNIKIVFFKN